MLREVVGVRQIAGESKRRWFASPDFDLIVWLADDGAFTGFELCYDKQGEEHSILWSGSGGFRHMAVDDGEPHAGKHKASPMLVPNGLFDARRIHWDFREASGSLPEGVAAFVLRAIEQHPEFAAAP